MVAQKDADAVPPSVLAKSSEARQISNKLFTNLLTFQIPCDYKESEVHGEHFSPGIPDS